MKKKDIEKIDLTELSNYITNEESKKFFLEGAGKEHYKLLAYLSKSVDGITITEFGTFRGCSALALAYNPKNKVVSYDVVNNRALNGYPGNIEFRMFKAEITRDMMDLLNSNLIFVDTDHSGDFEREVMGFLVANEWQGNIIYDDIHLNDEMKDFWNSVDTIDKQDLTNLGHWSGTGVFYLR